ncbi:MAG: hypothetical protein ACREXY_27520 [Gammaproteobacteria bacterium]
MLEESEQFLERSAEAFDEGFEAEAKRLSVVLRVLLHDTNQSHSLLQQLRLKDRLTYLDSADPINPNNLMATPGLVLMRMTAEVNRAAGQYVAPLGMERPSGVRLVPFAGWWHNDVMKVDGTWSRKQLVLTLANKEGGAHVDSSLDARYEDLAKHNGLGWMVNGPGEAAPFAGNVVAIGVRQIAYELLETLGRERHLLV